VSAATLQRPLRIASWALIFGGIAFAVLYVLVIAQPPPIDETVKPTWRTTTFGSALDNPKAFVRILLDGLTLAGLFFIVASGFTLIFGLMRVVNMAHGAFFLLGGWIALELQRDITGSGDVPPTADQVTLGNWVAILLVAALAIGLLGLAEQQTLLRWNQGQDLRQALITIALSIIIVDQLVPRLGVAKDIVLPSVIGLDQFVNLRLYDIQYPRFRLFALGLAIVIGLGLWLWLKRTRTGMVIRAGVDDRAMVSALGVNIQLTFAIAFFVGSALAGVGGVMGGSFSSLAQGTTEAEWLLNSLVVVIIGGMGSLLGAAIGAVLLGLVTAFSGVYLPTTSFDCCTQYSSILTFALLAAVLAVRPLGLFGRPA
jgi:branched-chain amino acid transport system permease protein